VYLHEGEEGQDFLGGSQIELYEGSLKSSWTGGTAPLLFCYASLCITVAYCVQSPKFSNGRRSCSAILKRALLKRL
jgi:hypothetical protein